MKIEAVITYQTTTERTVVVEVPDGTTRKEAERLRDIEAAVHQPGHASTIGQRWLYDPLFADDGGVPRW